MTRTRGRKRVFAKFTTLQKKCKEKDFEVVLERLESRGAVVVKNGGLEYSLHVKDKKKKKKKKKQKDDDDDDDDEASKRKRQEKDDDKKNDKNDENVKEKEKGHECNKRKKRKRGHDEAVEDSEQGGGEAEDWEKLPFAERQRRRRRVTNGDEKKKKKKKKKKNDTLQKSVAQDLQSHEKDAAAVDLDDEIRKLEQELAQEHTDDDDDESQNNEESTPRDAPFLERIPSLPASLLPARTKSRKLKAIDAADCPATAASRHDDGLRQAAQELLAGYTSRSMTAAGRGIPFYCRTCSHSSANAQEFEQHLQSPLHKATMHEAQKATYCRLCRKQFNSIVQMKEHLQSRPHKQQLEYCQQRQLQRGGRRARGAGYAVGESHVVMTNKKKRKDDARQWS